MTEQEFWMALQFRLTREFERRAGDDIEIRRWCMGVLPRHYDSDAILADADISPDDGRTFETYTCQVWVPPRMRRRTIPDWTPLLPAESAHEWLRVDHEAKWIGIRAEPARRAGFV